MTQAERGLRESSFTSKNGKKIFCRYWCEDLNKPRALVFISHGAAEHCLYYSPLALQLKNAGCYVFAHDHVGHGQSEGDRVHVNDIHEYVDDVFYHLDMVSERFPDIPKFIIGHSMGGAIAIIALIERPDFVNGMVLISPAVTTDPGTISPLKMFLAYQIARLVPQMALAWMDPWFITRNTILVQKYLDDPLVYHGGLKARWGASFLKWLQWIESNMSRIVCPLLVMHGTADRLTTPEGSKKLAKYAESKDKTLKIYEGYYHQLHYEPEEDGAGVRREIIEWISARCKAA
ncbi:monoglyceride lipase-like isoform X3 [Pomacea canaliculata]|uniref:monoglyceride lipase-like isoform X3 n=1 Tax=Pomacea canaliculata TaxID=400727 RepID=UPI000D7268F6|nr:monoglyceride lipase-like isoform X3 [Pomacea canaliculata]